jgi:hypothetical protein
VLYPTPVRQRAGRLLTSGMIRRPASPLNDAARLDRADFASRGSPHVSSWLDPGQVGRPGLNRGRLAAVHPAEVVLFRRDVEDVSATSIDVPLAGRPHVVDEAIWAGQDDPLSEERRLRCSGARRTGWRYPEVRVGGRSGRRPTLTVLGYRAPPICTRVVTKGWSLVWRTSWPSSRR